jgi:integrase
MALTDTAVRNTKPGDKPRKLADGKGLYLLINQAGKYWRFDYRFDQKRRTLAIGVYPDISLASAREKRDAARTLLANDVDPSEHRKAQKAARSGRAASSFEIVGREWFAKFSPNWVASHGSKILLRLENDIFPWLGERPIAEITAPELLACLRRIESRGAVETAHRVLQNCGQIFRYAVATGRANRDPCSDLRGALPPVKQRHHPSITDPKEIGKLLRVIRSYQGSFITKCALMLAPLVFVRPGELRKAEWTEFNLDQAEWRIPAEKMKMREVHIVPLSTQAVATLRELHKLTGSGRYVFPGARTNGRPMSENTVNAALRRLDYGSDELTGHGFRSMASTLLNEQGWHRDAIERQLAHGERNSVRAAYNYAEHLPERRRMMQSWADFLDGLAAGADSLSQKPNPGNG